MGIAKNHRFSLFTILDPEGGGELRKELNSAVSNIAQLSAKVEKRLAILERKEKEWKGLEDRIAENAARAKTKVHFIVAFPFSFVFFHRVVFPFLLFRFKMFFSLFWTFPLFPPFPFLSLFSISFFIVLFFYPFSFFFFSLSFSILLD